MREIDEVAAEMMMTGLNPRQATLLSELIFLAKQSSTTAERRRAWDRQRKRNGKKGGKVIPPDSTGIPPEKGGTPTTMYKQTMDKPCTDVVKVKVGRARGKKISIPPEFHPTPAHYEIGTRFGFPPAWVDDQLELLRGWATENFKLKADWGLTLSNWLKRGGINAKHRSNYSAPHKSEARTLSNATGLARGALQHITSVAPARPKNGEIQGLDDFAGELDLRRAG